MARKEWLPLDSRRNYPPLQAASLTKRVFACLYDLLIVFASFIFLELSISFLPIKNSEIISEGLFLFYLFIYFVWSTYKIGTTPGKKYFNLKVVHHLHAGQPTFITVLYRELILKPFSFLSCAYIYWKFKHHEDSISFQDHYSDTRVIVDQSEPDVLTQNSIPFLALTPLLVPIAFVYSTVFLATPLPLLKIKSELASMGVQTEEIVGNTVKGFKIKGLRFSYKDSLATLKDIRFDLNIPELILHQKVVINKFKINSLDLVSPENETKNPSGKMGERLEIISAFAPASLEIRDMSFQNFSIYGERGNHLQVFNLKITPERSYSIKNLIADTQSLTIDAREISYNPQNNIMKISPSQLAIKSQFHPKLAKDVELSVTAEFNLNEMDQATFNIQTRDNKVRFFQNEKSFVLNIHELDLRPWLNLPWPVPSVSLNYYDNVRFSQILKNPNILFTQQADIVLRDKKFSLVRNAQKKNANIRRTLAEINCEYNPCLNYKDRSFQLQFDLKNLLSRKETTKLKIDDASKNFSYNSSEDFLSQVYFNKNFSNLSDNEKASVLKDLPTLDLNPSRVADEMYLNEVRQFNKNKFTTGYLTAAGKSVLGTLRQNRSALNIFKAIAYLQSIDECPSILALPSELFTDLIIQQPKLKGPLYNTLGFCAKDPSLAISLFKMARAEAISFDDETLYHMALANYKLGSPQGALLLLNQFIQFRGQHAEAQHLIEKLTASSQAHPESQRKPASQKLKKRKN